MVSNIFFDTKDQYEVFKKSGRIIEDRRYKVNVDGKREIWHYYTVKDIVFFTDDTPFLGIGTLVSYRSLVQYLGDGSIIPIYLYVSDDGERLRRALCREESQQHPNYVEMCRRYLADEVDFCYDELEKSSITDACKFCNDELNECIDEIESFIKSAIELL